MSAYEGSKWQEENERKKYISETQAKIKERVSKIVKEVDKNPPPMNSKDTIALEVGSRIKDIRKVRGISQDEFSKSIGLTRTSIVNIEKGRQHLSVYNLIEIVRVLNCSPMDILPSADNPISLSIEATICELKEEAKQWREKYNNLTNHLNKIKEHL